MDRDTGAFSILLAFLMLLALFLTSPAKAGEIRVGAGINCGDLVGDGAWTQEGLPYEMIRCKEAIAIQYVGNTKIYWLDYAVGGFYRRGTKVHGEYISDGCYGSGTFSGAGCTPYLAAIETKAIGMTFTINPTWKVTHKFSLSTAIGASVFQANTKAVLENPRGSCPAGPCAGYWFRRGGISPYMELTAKYGQWFMTAYSAPLEFAPETPSHGNEGVVAGYSFKL